MSTLINSVVLLLPAFNKSSKLQTWFLTSNGPAKGLHNGSILPRRAIRLNCRTHVLIVSGIICNNCNNPRISPENFWDSLSKLVASARSWCFLTTLPAIREEEAAVIGRGRTYPHVACNVSERNICKQLSTRKQIAKSLVHHLQRRWKRQ